MWGSVNYLPNIQSNRNLCNKLNCNSVTTIVIPTEATVNSPTYYIECLNLNIQGDRGTEDSSGRPTSVVYEEILS